MSIISLDMIGMVIEELNRELYYKIDEHSPLPEVSNGHEFVTLASNGVTHKVLFMGREIWNSSTYKNYDGPTIEQEMTFGESENFEKHLRICLQDELRALSSVDIINK